uniref:SUMO-activating enzyme subunit n=1 Tax=Culicoides sonorensis TaxID=179676 RepID=A0A336K919_CULSO
MAASVDGVFQQSLAEKIKTSKILVVGAGGIGCEILKNLVMSGFKDIEIIDLDTIDVSNLNRQFLFHKEHVGKSKAQVARESALAFNPNTEIKAYHDSITTPDYGVSFFQRFKLVLNALDNRVARNHVNRMCLTADVPLIESGTAGYNGQVELIKRGLTQCYECTPKSAQKTYPGCTIRNTPSEPVHCIVWAKHLFNQLFGEANADEDVSPDTADPELGGEAGNEALNSEANEKGNVDRVNTRQWAQQCNYDAEKLFNKFFHDDIQYLLSMSNLWKNRTAPTPAKWDELGESVTRSDPSGTLRDQVVWSLRECGDVFKSSVAALSTELVSKPDGDHLVWDKDDKHAMDFVTACANTRAHIFNIPKKSRFDIKSISGNIIPAIATTNAITAGISVLHAFKVLQENYKQCQSVYLRLRPNARNQLFVPERDLTAPNPKCYVCAAKPEVTIKVDTDKVTVGEFRDTIMINALNMINPDVMMEDGKGTILISSEEGETDCNLEKKLKEFHIVDGSILKADDFLQNYELTITILHKDAGRDEELFEVIADPDTLKPENQSKEEEDKSESKENGDETPSAKKQKMEVEDSDDDLCIVEEDDETTNDSKQKPEPEKSVQEKRKTEDDAGPSTKRPKIIETVEIEDDDVITIDDD